MESARDNLPKYSGSTDSDFGPLFPQDPLRRGVETRTGRLRRVKGSYWTSASSSSEVRTAWARPVRSLMVAGASVCSLHIAEESGRTVAWQTGADFLPCDVTSREQVFSAIDSAVGELCGLDA